MLKVLGVPANSFSSMLHQAGYVLKVLTFPPAVYQKALLTSELEEIFANAPQAPTASVQHTGLKKAWAKATGSPVKDEDSGGKKRAPEEGDTCPIVSFGSRLLVILLILDLAFPVF